MPPAMVLLQHKPLFGSCQGLAKIGGHGVFQGQGIGYGGGFVAAVHGQLGEANVYRGDGDLAYGDAA